MVEGKFFSLYEEEINTGLHTRKNYIVVNNETKVVFYSRKNYNAAYDYWQLLELVEGGYEQDEQKSSQEAPE